jgi:hypothetical protein
VIFCPFPKKREKKDFFFPFLSCAQSPSEREEEEEIARK